MIFFQSKFKREAVKEATGLDIQQFQILDDGSIDSWRDCLFRVDVTVRQIIKNNSYLLGALLVVTKFKLMLVAPSVAIVYTTVFSPRAFGSPSRPYRCDDSQ